MSSMFIREVSIAEFREKFMKLFPARSFICCCCIQASTIFGGGITKIIRRSTTTSSSSFSRGIIVIKFWYIFSWRFFNILQINSAFSSRLLSTFNVGAAFMDPVFTFTSQNRILSYIKPYRCFPLFLKTFLFKLL